MDKDYRLQVDELIEFLQEVSQVPLLKEFKGKEGSVFSSAKERSQPCLRAASASSGRRVSSFLKKFKTSAGGKKVWVLMSLMAFSADVFRKMFIRSFTSAWL